MWHQEHLRQDGIREMIIPSFYIQLIFCRTLKHVHKYITRAHNLMSFLQACRAPVCCCTHLVRFWIDCKEQDSGRELYAIRTLVGIDASAAGPQHDASALLKGNRG